MSITLLSSQTTNGGPGPVASERMAEWRRSPLTLYLTGTFNNATVTLSASADGVTFLPIPEAVFTAPGIYLIDLNAMQLQAVVSGAGASTSISAIGM